MKYAAPCLLNLFDDFYMDFCEPDIAEGLVLEFADIFVTHGEIAEEAYGMECNASQETEFYHDYGFRNDTISGACDPGAGNFNCLNMEFHLVTDAESFVYQVNSVFVYQEWVDLLELKKLNNKIKIHSLVTNISRRCNRAWISSMEYKLVELRDQLYC